MTIKATDRCGQCGKQYKAKACGPTHAAVYAAIKNVPVAKRSDHIDRLRERPSQ